jgi:hypothetical protein
VNTGETTSAKTGYRKSSEALSTCYRHAEPGVSAAIGNIVTIAVIPQSQTTVAETVIVLRASKKKNWIGWTNG